MKSWMKKTIIVVLSFTGLLTAQSNLSFNEAYQIAVENSPDIQQAKLSYERSSELLNAQEASLKSQFSLSVEPFAYLHTRTFNDFFSTWNTSETKQSSGMFTVSQPLIWTDGTLALQNRFMWRDTYSEFQDTRSETFSNNLYLVYNQPLFTYNRTRMEFDEVRLDMENALLNYRIQELNLERRVAGSFYDTYQKRMNLQVSREELENTNASYIIIENKVNAGLTAKEELYQAELNLMNSKSAVYNAQAVYENALDALRSTLGISLFDSLSVSADISESHVEVELQKAIDHGLKNRMELRQRSINIQTALNNITRADASNEFKGNFSLQIGIIGTDEEVSNIYETPSQNQDISVSFDIPVFDWGQKESRVKAAEVTRQSNEISLNEEKRNIIIEIRQAYRNLQNQKYQIEIARQNVEVAQLAYDINLERYKNGDLTSMDLNLFQTQLSQNKNSLIDAMIAYRLSLLDLKISSLWDFERGQPVLKLDDIKIDNE